MQCVKLWRILFEAPNAAGYQAASGKVQRTGRVRHREASTLQENNLLRPWLPLAMGPDVINKGKREQHLEPMRPSRTFFSQRKNRPFFVDPSEQFHQNYEEPEIFHQVTMKDLFVLLQVNPCHIDFLVDPI